MDILYRGKDMAKRIEIIANGGPEVMDYVEFIPKDPAHGEVQVENKAIGVNFIDTYIRSGFYQTASLPTGLGNEAAGFITKVGSGITNLNVGDRVVYAQSALGAYASVHNVLAQKIIRLPDAISFHEAASSFLKGLTVYYLLHQTYALKSNEIFLFHAAAGGVGHIACQWSKALGAKMIGTVGSAHKAILAKQYGAWETIHYHEENVPKRVAELTQGKKVGVVYDSVGKSTWEDSLDSLYQRGLMVSFGNSSGAVSGVNLSILNYKGSLYVTRPSLNNYITNATELNYAADKLFGMIISGIIKINIPEKQKFILSDARSAHKALENRNTNGSLLLIP